MYNVGNAGNESSEEDGEEDEFHAADDEEMEDTNFSQFVEKRRSMQVNKATKSDE